MFEKLMTKLAALPVVNVAFDVASSLEEGNVTVLASNTGSGKTLVATSLLADLSDSQVVVCVPRRFLAVNAAETIAELAEVPLGEAVGFAVGGSEESKFSSQTRLLFVTYGYAIEAGLLETASVVVLDEVHEASEDISLARARLHRRLQNGGKIQLLEMSATINVEHQSQYWSNVSSTQIFEVDGKTFPCERLQSTKEPAHAALELLQKGRKGVLVFRPGVEEVEETAKAICANAKRILAEAARKMAAEAGFSAFLPQEQEELLSTSQSLIVGGMVIFF